MRILITGGAGFIGSSFVRYVLREKPDVDVLNFDLLTYAGNLRNLEEVDANPRYRFVRGDIADEAQVRALFEAAPIDAIVNFAAESHVDRSIDNPAPFLRSNIQGTQILLEAARRHRVSRYVQISTDEVYGSLGPHGAFREDTPLDPTSPYAASKACADLWVLSYVKTYKLPAVITRCSNNYGPYQFPEKFIPLVISNAMEDKPLPVYGDGLNVREWIHCDEHSRGVWEALERGVPGEAYNIGSGDERTNIEVVRTILNLLGKPESLITYVKDRPAHDRRYAMDCSRIQNEWNWQNRVDFVDGLRRTVEWYQAHQDWIAGIRDASYLNYYERMYTNRDNTLSWSGH